jgi:hypothetical protein
VTKLIAPECQCHYSTSLGEKKPLVCEEHGNRFVLASSVQREPISTAEAPPAFFGLDRPKPRRRSTLKRTSRKESKAERAARDHFNATVKGRGCWFADSRPCEECDGTGWWSDWNGEEGGAGRCGLCEGDGKHRCDGPLDAHHLVPKQFLRKRFQGVLPEDQFVAILFNPKIGAPLCRKAHDRIESGADRIYWDDLTDECIDHVFSLPDFVALRLEEDCPKRDPETTGREAA